MNSGYTEIDYPLCQIVHALMISQYQSLRSFNSQSKLTIFAIFRNRKSSKLYKVVFSFEIKVLNEVICIRYSAHTLGKGMNHPPAMGK